MEVEKRNDVSARITSCEGVRADVERCRARRESSEVGGYARCACEIVDKPAPVGEADSIDACCIDRQCGLHGVEDVLSVSNLKPCVSVIEISIHRAGHTSSIPPALYGAPFQAMRDREHDSTRCEHDLLTGRAVGSHCRLPVHNNNIARVNRQTTAGGHARDCLLRLCSRPRT
jgi:hypothetical protein